MPTTYKSKGGFCIFRNHRGCFCFIQKPQGKFMKFIPKSDKIFNTVRKMISGSTLFLGLKMTWILKSIKILGRREYKKVGPILNMFHDK